ncbi:MAG: hypothetical protein ABI467_10065 [Kofleriaceae bacterium]
MPAVVSQQIATPATPAVPREDLLGTDARDARRWLGLAVLALAYSGVLAIILVIGRIPGLAPALIHDPDFARRCLVVHVNLAVGVWFFSFVAGLVGLLPGPRPRRARIIAPSLTALGVVACAISMWFRSAAPVLSNYVPVLHDRLFLMGLALCALGISASFFDRRLLAVTRAPSLGPIPRDAALGLRTAACAFLIAMATIVVAYVTREPHGEVVAGYERLFWGGGHVLQIAAEMGMLAAWLILLRHETGETVLSPWRARVVFGSMLLPAFAAPWLTLDPLPNPAFTTIMELGLAPAVVVVIWSGARSLYRRRASCHAWSPAFSGLSTSVAMTLIGFMFGAAITANTTLTPAHYHMNIGAVTVAFMTVLLTFMSGREVPARWHRLAIWQPIIYGIGQSMFATGLGIAGFWGQAARKIYGPEQHGGTVVERSGLVFAGVGGLLALVGGAMFVVLIARAWRRRRLAE